ncbi:MAG: DJ-1/PfpI family protein [Deltaproteobacteria bacterium]|nr:DJ-1/PfpI family protein [Deltaproteobacteria bacterium]
MTKTALVPLADGFEEIEAITVIDVLRRAGVRVVVAGLEAGPRTGRSGIAVTPDTTLDEALACGPYDLIVLPGGLGGTNALKADARILAAVRDAAGSGRLVAAICAAPTVLREASVLGDGPFTSHPSVRGDMPAAGYVEDRVAVSGRIVTSRAAGTAMEFAYALLRELLGGHAVAEVDAGVMARK